MQEIDRNLLSGFRSPSFPGSLFISFEGIEGAGKSTQITRLKEHLESKDFRVIVLREPGGTVFGEKLRQAILNSTHPIHPLAEAHLFASARAQLLDEVVLKELETPGTAVICDRYLDSSIAYQGFARDLGVNNILKMHNTFPLNLVPHLTFYLRIGIESSMGRQKMRNAPKDYFESKGSEFYEKLVQGYDLAASLFSDRIEVINGEGQLEAVSAKITETCDNLLFQRSSNLK